MKDERLAEMNRKRVARSRAKKRSEGLIPVEVWVKQEDKAKLLEFAKSL